MLVDASVIIDFFKNDAKVTAILKQQRKIYLPAVALGELYLGAYRSANLSKHLAQIQTFINTCEVVFVDAETSLQYAIIKTGLLAMGKPIPENDIWIAAIAMQHSLPVFTKDNHFHFIAGLQIINS